MSVSWRQQRGFCDLATGVARLGSGGTTELQGGRAVGAAGAGQQRRRGASAGPGAGGVGAEAGRITEPRPASLLPRHPAAPGVCHA